VSGSASTQGEDGDEVEDVVLVLVIVVVLVLVLRPVLTFVRLRAQRARDAKHPGARPRHEWEGRTGRYYRRAAGVQGPAEDRDGILAFLDSRRGVEAYMEPKTAMSALSVVLVAEDGEWRRFELTDDSFIRDLSRTRSLPVLDAMRTGYPERMRRYKRPQPEDSP
jgi:hypothetical protein